MNNQSHPEPVTLSDLSKFLFNIPHYQRLFAWDKKEVDELLNDLLNSFLEKKDGYFLGNIILREDKESDCYDVIDGQQRLTAIWLLSLILYKISNDKSSMKNFLICKDKPRLSSKIRESENKFLLNIFNADDKDSDSIGKLIYFIQNLYVDSNKESIQINPNITEALFSMISFLIKTNVNVEEFSNYIRNNVTLIKVVLVINSPKDINRYFVRMNNRGKQLEQHEILKAKLLRKINDGERNYYAKIWDICSQMDIMVYNNIDKRLYCSNQKSDDKITETSFKMKNILEKGDNEIKTDNTDGSDETRVESIITFPKFLLYVLKLFLSENKLSKNKFEDVNIMDKTLIITFEKNLIDNDVERIMSFFNVLFIYRIIFDLSIIKRSKGEYDGQYLIFSAKELKDSSEYKLINKSTATVQNFLRVARPQDAINGYPWLAPILKYCRNKMINVFPENIISINNEEFDSMIKSLGNIINEAEMTKWIETLDNCIPIDAEIANYVNLILEKNDIELLETISLNDKIKENQVKTILENDNEMALLDNGTKVPHYWFHKLDYILYKKYQSKDKTFSKIDDKTLNDKLNKFYFSDSNNSIEHVCPQTNDDKIEWDIDSFGNLALISSSRNSSYSNFPGWVKKIFIVMIDLGV